MRTLVTGGCGFIGSHLADRLLSDGHSVVVVDDLSNGRIEFKPAQAQFLCSDFADPSTLRLVQQSRFDVVYHLAAKPRVSYSVERPAETNDENVGKTVRLLEACRGNVGRLVLASSSSVYGDAREFPTIEDCPHAPRSPYALQKSMCEQHCAMFADLYGMDVGAVRPFNVYGPRQLLNGAYSTVVPAWLSALKRGESLRLDGDGSQSRDFTYVTDVAMLFVAVVSYRGKLRGEAFNAGSGTSVSLNDVLRYLSETDPQRVAKARVEKGSSRAGDVRKTHADTSAAKAYLGWSPRVSFANGLRATHEWAMSSDLF